MSRKLYIKGKCTVCRGSALGCPYCDSEGLTFIEAADKVIAEIISEADEELKKKILEAIGG
jgi:hypothetical protein